MVREDGTGRTGCLEANRKRFCFVPFLTTSPEGCKHSFYDHFFREF